MEPVFVSEMRNLNNRLEDYLLQDGHSKNDDAYDALLNQTLALWNSLSDSDKDVLMNTKQ